jgi:hypothetical protein
MDKAKDRREKRNKQIQDLKNSDVGSSLNS